MAQVAAADPEAARRVATRFVGRARRVCGSLLGDSADAEDAAQMGLLEILQSAGSYRGEGSVERWADRIVVRTAMRLARGRRRVHEELDEESGEPVLVAPTPEADVAEEVPRPVSEYLGALSEPLRTVLVLRHVLDYSIDEIGEQTGVSQNTVKDRLLRAREQLRRMIRRDRFVGVRKRRETP